MRVHLIDGTYELFRHYFVVPKRRTSDGTEIAAARAVVRSLLGLLEGGATHVGVATDHVVESFRNELYGGYKTSAGVPPDLLEQFPILEDVLRAAGFTVWPMVEFEADDALGAAAECAARSEAVDQVVICTPDKDMAQCVRGDRVVMFDRRKQKTIDEQGVVERYGVSPDLIPDWLALVGDSSDGYPGLPGWGAKSTALVLSHYGHIENIPSEGRHWTAPVRGPLALAATLRDHMEDALLFRTLATLRTDAPVMSDADQIRWRQPSGDLDAWAKTLGAPDLLERTERLQAARA